MSANNLFMLVIDSLRADVVYGDRVPTPNFDRYIENGASFSQCIATATTTTPSFSSLLTGCYPPKHGVRGLQGYRLSPALTTMAEAFSHAGYRTYAEVTGPLLVETGVLRGFDEINHRPGYKQPFFGWRDDIVARMGSYAEPWFMLLHVWEVHRPFRPPPTFEKRWDRVGYEGVVAASDELLQPVFEAVGNDALVVITGDHGEEYPDTTWQKVVNRLSRKARRTLKPSKWAPSLDRKLAAHSVGHGFALFEHLIKVPLVMSGPGLGRVAVTEQVRHIDLFPTLSDLCGAPVPEGIDGRSLRPLIEGGTLAEEPAYMEAVGVKLEGDRITGVRTPDWKLLKPGRGKPALYRLNEDGTPNEKRNLYARHPEVARNLETIMERIASTDAATPSGMTSEEEATVEQHLRDLGYL